MVTFEFTLRIKQRLAEETEMDAVYARCADCSLFVDGDVTLLRFQREAVSLQEAIRSAIADVNSVGYHIEYVEMEADSVVAQTA